MTTIAWDGRSLAADRRVLAGTNYMGEAIKITRSPDGRWAGAAGGSAECNQILAWVHNGMKPDELPPSQATDDFCNVLVVYPDGKAELFSKHGYSVAVKAPFAVGSGSEYARGAMAAGVDARGAVEIAMRFDMATGDGVDCVEVCP